MNRIPPAAIHNKQMLLHNVLAAFIAVLISTIVFATAATLVTVWLHMSEFALLLGLVAGSASAAGIHTFFYRKKYHLSTLRIPKLDGLAAISDAEDDQNRFVAMVLAANIARSRDRTGKRRISQPKDAKTTEEVIPASGMFLAQSEYVRGLVKAWANEKAIFRKAAADEWASIRKPDASFSALLQKGSVWTGSLIGSGGMLIDGRFGGNIIVHGFIVVGETGRVRCEQLRANVVIVSGAVRGDIIAEMVEIRSTGRVWGNVTTSAFRTEEGAFLQGQIRMEEQIDIDIPPMARSGIWSQDEAEEISRGEAARLQKMAEMYHATGQPRKALELYEQTLSVARAAGDQTGEAVILNNMALVYYYMGRPRKALELFEQALPIRREVGDQRGEATTLNYMALVYLDTGQSRKALELFEQALSISREVGDHYGERANLYSLAWLYQNQGRLEEAVAEFRRLVELDRQLGHPDLESDLSLLQQIERKLKGEAG